MSEPKFGDIYEWKKGTVEITVMVIGPEFEPPKDDPWMWQVTVIRSNHFALGFLNEYQLQAPGWTRVHAD